MPAARLIAVSPSHQFPLGVTMSLKRRLELLELMAQGEKTVEQLAAESDGNGVLFKKKDDPRVTRVGRFMLQDTIGNFWVDLVRGTVYVLLPLSLVFALSLIVAVISTVLAVGMGTLTAYGFSRFRVAGV